MGFLSTGSDILKNRKLLTKPLVNAIFKAFSRQMTIGVSEWHILWVLLLNGIVKYSKSSYSYTLTLFFYMQ